jgi:uncharacterized protein YoxC
MADEKSNKTKKNSDSKKTGNSCGFSIGCLIIIVAVAVVLFFLFLKPALEEAGYSYDDLKRKFLDLKNNASDTLDKTDKLYEDGKEKYEDIKDKTDEHLDDLKDLDVKSREELNKTAPKLIAD